MFGLGLGSPTTSAVLLSLSKDTSSWLFTKSSMSQVGGFSLSSLFYFMRWWSRGGGGGTFSSSITVYTVANQTTTTITVASRRVHSIDLFQSLSLLRLSPLPCTLCDLCLLYLSGEVAKLRRRFMWYDEDDE